MPEYAWKALNDEGHTVKGTSFAVDEVALQNSLEQAGQMLLKASEVKRSFSFAESKVGFDQIVNFSFQSSMMLRAGVPLLETLHDIASTESHTVFRRVVVALGAALSTGKTLSQAMAMHPKVFDDVYVNLIQAGEQTGQLTEVLEDLTKTLKWQQEMASQTKKALIYPVIVTIVIFGVVLFMLGFVVPQIAQLLKTMNIPLPLPTRVLIAASDFVSGYWWAIVIFFGALFGLAPVILKIPGSMRNTVDAWKLRLPIIGRVLSRIALARFAYILSMLYAAGITVMDALTVVEKAVGNRAMAGAVAAARIQISKGKSLSAAFAGSPLFPPMVISMLRVGEATGALDTALKNVSDMYTREAREAVENLQASLQPIMTVVLGLILTGIMVFTLGPLYESVIGAAKF